MDVDLDQDGRKEVFLSEPASWSKRGFLWQVYSPSESGFDHLGSVTFNRGYLVMESAAQTLAVLEPVSIGVFDLVTYEIADQLEETSRSRLEEPKDEKRIEDFRLRAKNFLKEREPVRGWSAFAQGKLLPWVEATTRKELKGLQPISELEMSAAEESESLDLYGHLSQRLPCTWVESCAIYMLRMDLTADGADELLLRNSQAHSNLGWMVYEQTADGFVFLGSLQFDMGWIRADSEGGVVVLRSHPSSLVAYQVEEKRLEKVWEVDCRQNPSRCDPERKRMINAWRGHSDEYLKVDYQCLSENRADAEWQRLGGDVGVEKNVAAGVNFSYRVIVPELPHP